MRESGRITHEEFERTILRLLHSELLELLKSSKSQTEVNNQGENSFSEKIHRNGRLGIRISTPIPNADSYPQTDSTFVIILAKSPQTVIVVPPDSQHSKEIRVGNLWQKNLQQKTVYLPTHPQQIKEIIDCNSIRTQRLSLANLDWLLNYLLNLKDQTS